MTAAVPGAVIAATRVGYGADPDGLGGIGGDPRGWLKVQLERPGVPAVFEGMADTASLVAEYQRAEALTRTAKTDGTQAAPEIKEEQQRLRAAYLREAAARIVAATTSEAPFTERLVAFWANHFTVSGIRPAVRGIAGSFEREAIRPNITGRFQDMLLAVARHPAMGIYLDNAFSIGPNSQAGIRRGKGLNENFGREVLELHTLGVDGGYTEEDVRALARILTGWSIGRPTESAQGRFMYRPAFHEPGPKVLFGRSFPEGGQVEGEAALILLATHPSTARHIARKLAVHFISDEPPAAAVDALAAVWRKTGGDLRAVTMALVDLPDAWSETRAKVKTPYELVVSALRATGVHLSPEQTVQSMARLGQPLFHAPSPAGWPDTAAAWIGPEAILRRVEWCQTLADTVVGGPDPAALGEVVLASALGAETKTALARAESRSTGLALLLASADFQRR